MSDIAAQIIFHPKASQALKLWSTTVGRDKTYRLVQYFARFLAWFLLNQGQKVEAARWGALKSSLGTGRKMMRLGKPLEHVQAALKATQNPSLAAHAAEQITTIGRQVGYAGYLTYDSLVWANAVKFIALTPERAKQISKTSARLWLAGILFSISHGIIKTTRLGNDVTQLKYASKSGEKDVGEEAEKKIKIKALLSERAAVTYQLVQDCFDIWLPISSLELVSVNDGLLGVIGVITSLMALRLQWAKAGKA